MQSSKVIPSLIDVEGEAEVEEMDITAHKKEYSASRKEKDLIQIKVE